MQLPHCFICHQDTLRVGATDQPMVGVDCTECKASYWLRAHVKEGGGLEICTPETGYGTEEQWQELQALIRIRHNKRVIKGATTT